MQLSLLSTESSSRKVRPVWRVEGPPASGKLLRLLAIAQQWLNTEGILAEQVWVLLPTVKDVVCLQQQLNTALVPSAAGGFRLMTPLGFTLQWLQSQAQDGQPLLQRWLESIGLKAFVTSAQAENAHAQGFGWLSPAFAETLVLAWLQETDQGHVKQGQATPLTLAQQLALAPRLAAEVLACSSLSAWQKHCHVDANPDSLREEASSSLPLLKARYHLPLEDLFSWFYLKAMSLGRFHAEHLYALAQWAWQALPELLKAQAYVPFQGVVVAAWQRQPEAARPWLQHLLQTFPNTAFSVTPGLLQPQQWPLLTRATTVENMQASLRLGEQHVAAVQAWVLANDPNAQQQPLTETPFNKSRWAEEETSLRVRAWQALDEETEQHALFEQLAVAEACPLYDVAFVLPTPEAKRNWEKAFRLWRTSRGEKPLLEEPSQALAINALTGPWWQALQSALLCFSLLQPCLQLLKKVSSQTEPEMLTSLFSSGLQALEKALAQFVKSLGGAFRPFLAAQAPPPLTIYFMLMPTLQSFASGLPLQKQQALELLLHLWQGWQAAPESAWLAWQLATAIHYPKVLENKNSSTLQQHEWHTACHFLDGWQTQEQLLQQGFAPHALTFLRLPDLWLKTLKDGWPQLSETQTSLFSTPEPLLNQPQFYHLGQKPPALRPNHLLFAAFSESGAVRLTQALNEGLLNQTLLASNTPDGLALAKQQSEEQERTKLLQQAAWLLCPTERLTLSRFLYEDDNPQQEAHQNEAPEYSTALPAHSLYSQVLTLWSLEPVILASQGEITFGESQPKIILQTKRLSWFQPETLRLIRSKSITPVATTQQLILTPSHLNTFTQCPKRYAYRYQLKLPQEQVVPKEDKALKGNLLHYIMEVFNRQTTSETHTLEQLLTLSERMLKVEQHRHQPLNADEAWPEKLHTALWGFTLLERADLLDFATKSFESLEKTGYFEQTFVALSPECALPPRPLKGLPSQVLWQGRLDNLFLYDEGYLLVVDYKTSASHFNVMNSEKPALALQQALLPHTAETTDQEQSEPLAHRTRFDASKLSHYAWQLPLYTLWLWEHGETLYNSLGWQQHAPLQGVSAVWLQYMRPEKPQALAWDLELFKQEKDQFKHWLNEVVLQPILSGAVLEAAPAPEVCSSCPYQSFCPDAELD